MQRFTPPAEMFKQKTSGLLNYKFPLIVLTPLVSGFFLMYYSLRNDTDVILKERKKENMEANDSLARAIFLKQTRLATDPRLEKLLKELNSN